MITRIRIEVSERIADEAARRVGIKARKRALKRYCAKVLRSALRELDSTDHPEPINVR